MSNEPRKFDPDFSLIRGNEHIKRALEIAVAGQHSLVMTGSPGLGKTTLMQAAIQLCRDQEWCYVNNSALEINWGSIGKAITQGYFIGLEKWPCPCGYFGDMGRECICTNRQIIDYHLKTYELTAKSEIHVEAVSLGWEKIADTRPGETSQQILGRISRAQEIQSARYGNGQLNGLRQQVWDLTFFKQLDSACEKLLKQATQMLQLTPESVFNVVRIARTIADLADSTKIQAAYVAEAIQYRPRRPLLALAQKEKEVKGE